MIAELCPEGVEYKKLGEVCVSINTGLNPRKFFSLNTDDANNFYVTIKEMRGGKITFLESTDKINDEALRLCNNRSNLEVGDLLFSGTGTIGVTVIIKEEPKTWNIKEGVYAIKPKHDMINVGYLNHILNSTSIKEAYLKRVAGGTVKSIPMKSLANVEIPLPPLPIQEEIVRILDKFTQLEAELEAELDCRKRQYEFYRDKLLSFNDIGGG